MFLNFSKTWRKHVEYNCSTTSLQLVHVTKRHQSLCRIQIIQPVQQSCHRSQRPRVCRRTELKPQLGENGYLNSAIKNCITFSITCFTCVGSRTLVSARVGCWRSPMTPSVGYEISLQRTSVGCGGPHWSRVKSRAGPREKSRTAPTPWLTITFCKASRDWTSSLAETWLSSTVPTSWMGELVPGSNGVSHLRVTGSYITSRPVALHDS